jgi:uncharacterized membrane protein
MELSIPPGWDYNPSRWPERLILVGLALVGFGIATYLTLYQLGVVPVIWEPFFGDGSQVILHSRLARLLPVPDASLGALGYLVEAVSGAVGDSTRWRSRPWVVIWYGCTVGLLGLMSILLAICQPVLFRAWCTLCLVSAALSICLVGPVMDEVLASLQHLKHESAHGDSCEAACRRDT